MTAAQNRDRLRERLDTWSVDASIEDSIAGNALMVATWVDLCAPPGAPAENQALACRDLSVVFFALDDYEGPDEVEVFAGCERALEGQAPKTAAPLVRAYASVIREIEARGQDTTEYKSLRRALIREYGRRNRARNDGRHATSEGHMARRRTTIYTRQWIGLWEILEACPLTEQERASGVVSGILDEIVDWQILENELVSVDRDRERGEDNLVLLIARERSIEVAAAGRIVSDLHRASSERLEQLLARLAEQAASARLRRYWEILDRCYRGAVEINAARLPRYRRIE